ncbi:hypothetical protein [Gordonia shandongensis]|uniref:hypothetical protein n=1 Tax=Gordonia shandongensis TaxID=376351 RepID=UPI00068422D1|nr:hypothetical protein [Gordonia shandongensis]
MLHSAQLADRINALGNPTSHKTELIDVKRSRSWTGSAEVEREAAAGVHWYNTERRHWSIGYTARLEHEERRRLNVPSTPEVD